MYILTYVHTHIHLHLYLLLYLLKSEFTLIPTIPTQHNRVYSNFCISIFVTLLLQRENWLPLSPIYLLS